MSGRITSMSRFNESIPEPAEVATCEQCHGEIYAGDEVYRIDDGGGYVHEHCASTYAKERVYDAYGAILAEGDLDSVN